MHQFLSALINQNPSCPRCPWKVYRITNETCFIWNITVTTSIFKLLYFDNRFVTNSAVHNIHQSTVSITSLTVNVCMNHTYFVKITPLGFLHGLFAWHLQNMQQRTFLSLQGQKQVAHFTQLYFKDTSSGKLRWHLFGTRHLLSMVNP